MVLDVLIQLQYRYGVLYIKEAFPVCAGSSPNDITAAVGLKYCL